MRGRPRNGSGLRGLDCSRRYHDAVVRREEFEKAQTVKAILRNEVYLGLRCRTKEFAIRD